MKCAVGDFSCPSFSWLTDFTNFMLVRLVGGRSGTDTRTVQELLGHSDVSTTMMDTHVLKVAAGGTASPLGALLTG
jgi:integrase